MPARTRRPPQRAELRDVEQFRGRRNLDTLVRAAFRDQEERGQRGPRLESRQDLDGRRRGLDEIRRWPDLGRGRDRHAARLPWPTGAGTRPPQLLDFAVNLNFLSRRENIFCA